MQQRKFVIVYRPIEVQWSANAGTENFLNDDFDLSDSYQSGRPEVMTL